MRTSERQRDLYRLLRDLGYECVRHAKHQTIWRDGCGRQFSVSGSPSGQRWFLNALAELRRAHSGHPAFERVKADAETRAARRSRDRHRQHTLRSVPMVVAVKPLPVAVPDETSCVDCGRLWCSDVDPTRRACPVCGGQVVIGRRETREFRWRLLA